MIAALCQFSETERSKISGTFSSLLLDETIQVFATRFTVSTKLASVVKLLATKQTSGFLFF